MRFLFLKAWPAFIPLAIYILWLLWRRKQARESGEPMPRLISKPFLIALSSSLLILAICLFYVGLSAPRNAGTDYQPKQYKDGQLIQEEWQ